MVGIPTSHVPLLCLVYVGAGVLGACQANKPEPNPPQDVPPAPTAYPVVTSVAAAPAAPDTSLRARIARHYSDYRLSTADDIALRFKGVGKPFEFTDDLWIASKRPVTWNGDFDGDGRQDQLVLLSRKDKPISDALVVFFANGKVAKVIDRIGFGLVQIYSKKDTGENADIVNLYHGEGEGSGYLWNGKAFGYWSAEG